MMNRLLSVFVLILILAAPAAAAGPDRYDLFYDDGTSATLNEVTINFPQSHAIGAADDWDWATFPAEAGMPYSVKLEQAGADVDLELRVYMDGPSNAPAITEFAGFGGGETFTRQSWPSTGRFWLAVRAADWRAGATSYTLTVTRNTGANLGLATISGSKMSSGGPGSGGVQLPTTMSTSDGSQVPLMYTAHELSWATDTFTAATSHLVLLGGLGDPSNSLSSPYVVRWMEKFPHNLTITRVGLFPAEDPLQPLALTIEMKTQATTMDLSDGYVTIAGYVARDVPEGGQAGGARVWHWSQASGQWVLFDVSPTVIQAEGAWRVTTRVSHLDLDLSNSDYFAASVDVPQTRAGRWTLYR